MYGLTQREDITEDERTQCTCSKLVNCCSRWKIGWMRYVRTHPEGRQETQQFLQQEQQRLAQMRRQGASEADLAEQQALIDTLQNYRPARKVKQSSNCSGTFVSSIRKLNARGC